MNIKQALGIKIRELRKKQKISQERFSELIDMTSRQIVRIEQGESFPTAENLEKIANILSVRPQDLFDWQYNCTNENMREEIKKMVDNLDSKELKLTYLLVKNF